MEDLAKKVLSLLEEDARYSSEKIAIMLGTTKEEVEKTIGELEDNGTIVKYTAVINQEKVVKDLVDALVEVKVTPQARNGFEKIAQEISEMEQVKSVYLMSGTYDFAVTLEGTTVKDVALFVSEKLSLMESVVSVATHFILKKYKDGGVTLCDFGKVDTRLSIHE